MSSSSASRSAAGRSATRPGPPPHHVVAVAVALLDDREHGQVEHPLEELGGVHRSSARSAAPSTLLCALLREGQEGWRPPPGHAAPRGTSAKTRVGLPEPRTIFSGATTSSAPVAGSRARLASWVRPYLPLPSR